MSDAAPADVQDQPIDQPDAPDSPDQPTDDQPESFTDFDASQIPEDADREWLAERYQQMQSDYTRKTMDTAEQRREAERYAQIVEALQNPQVAPSILQQLGYNERQILDMFGYQLDDDEPSNEEPDLMDEVSELKQWKERREAQESEAQREEAVIDYISEEIDALEKREDREFDAEEHRALEAYARTYPAQNGAPDVKGAFELLSGIVKSRQQAMLGPKKGTPRPPGTGKPGSRRVDLSKESQEERRERMAEAVNVARASSA